MGYFIVKRYRSQKGGEYTHAFAMHDGKAFMMSQAEMVENLGSWIAYPGLTHLEADYFLWKIGLLLKDREKLFDSLPEDLSLRLQSYYDFNVFPRYEKRVEWAELLRKKVKDPAITSDIRQDLQCIVTCLSEESKGFMVWGCMSEEGEIMPSRRLALDYLLAMDKAFFYDEPIIHSISCLHAALTGLTMELLGYDIWGGEVDEIKRLLDEDPGKLSLISRYHFTKVTDLSVMVEPLRFQIISEKDPEAAESEVKELTKTYAPLIFGFLTQN